MGHIHFHVPWEIFLLPAMLVILFIGALIIYCYCLEPCCRIDPGGHLAPDPRIRVPTPIPSYTPIYSPAKLPVVLLGEELIHDSDSVFSSASKLNEQILKEKADSKIDFHWDFSSCQSGLRTIQSGIKYARSKSKPIMSASEELFRSRREWFLQRCREKLLRPPGKESKSHSGELNIPKASTSFASDTKDIKDYFHSENEIPTFGRGKHTSIGGQSEDLESISEGHSHSIDLKSHDEEDEFSRCSSEEFDSAITDSMTPQL